MRWNGWSRVSAAWKTALKDLEHVVYLVEEQANRLTPEVEKLGKKVKVWTD